MPTSVLTADVFAVTATGTGVTDNAEYTGQYFESDGQVYAGVPSFFFSSEIGLTVVRASAS
jgi:hypothetical protein